MRKKKETPKVNGQFINATVELSGLPGREEPKEVSVLLCGFVSIADPAHHDLPEVHGVVVFSNGSLNHFPLELIKVESNES